MTEYEGEELKREALRAVTRAQARLDQISAACRDEKREPTKEEWKVIRKLILGDEEDSDGEA